VDEISENENTPAANETNITACNPTPCLGANSTCEIINVTHFECHCASRQNGTRCELVRVGVDSETPSRLANIISIVASAIIISCLVIACLAACFSKGQSAIVPPAPTELQLRKPLIF